MALTYVGDAHAAKGGQGGGGAKRRGSRVPRSSFRHHQQVKTAQQQTRSSVRSKGSSSTGSAKDDRVKKLKNFCRATVLFMFTQVGVGAVVVAYTLMGASIFTYIETLEEDPTIGMVERLRNDTVATLWNLTDYFNVLNKDRLIQEIDLALHLHEKGMVYYIKEQGYDEHTNEERWTFSAALMFALSVITMIGYGNVVPRTDTGKIATIVYACFGIPVYILYFMNMGKVFAAVLKWVYTKAYRWNVRRKWKQTMEYDGMTGEDYELDEAYLDELEQQVIVPSTTCLWVMVFYLVLGTVMFAEWERWNYLDSVYFCVISLSKIGFGDFVPGTHEQLEGASSEETQAKLVITFVYLLVGMGVVAMCYYLLKEDVTNRVTQTKERLKEKLLRLKVRLGWAPSAVLEQV